MIILFYIFLGIAFTASISKSIASFGTGATIIWDSVITNEGNAYNGYTGIFSCSEDGLYAFNWNLMSGSNGQECIGTITHNGRKILAANAQENGSAWEMASNSIVLQLRKGDRIWIAASQCTFTYGYPRASLNGWQL